jgi:hypothetical protein
MKASPFHRPNEGNPMSAKTSTTRRRTEDISAVEHAYVKSAVQLAEETLRDHDGRECDAGRKGG